MNAFEMNIVVEGVVRTIAPAITARYRSSVSSSGLKRRSGASVRGFQNSINRDSATGEIWGVSFKTLRYVYIHHHGMKAKTVDRSNGSYAHKGLTKRGMLTTPSQQGAAVLATAISAAEANYIVKGIRF